MDKIRAAFSKRKLRIMRLRFQRKISRFGLPDYVLFSIFSIIAGASAGLAAVLFHKTIHFFNYIFFEKGLNYLEYLGGGAVIIIPVIGMFILSIMRKSAPHTAKKQGILEVIKAVIARGGYIPFKTTIFHFFAPAICIGSGGTVGPEGPAAQIGGGVANKIGQLFGISDSRRRMFTVAGAGAAIAAVFNTPLGGVFFALELILLNDFQAITFSSLILASVTASAISRIFLGDTPTFIFEHVSVGDYSQLYLFAILGIGAGIISLLFTRYSESVDIFFKKQFMEKIPRWVIMSSVGLVFGTFGYFYNDIFGIGYGVINNILSSSLSWKIVLILLVLKFVFVPLILRSGGFGGIFAPSLFIGACFGYLYAIVLNNVFGLNIDAATYVLVSMGAVLGGINSIPIASILIIFEMTKDYSFILPLMFAVVLSTTIVQLVMKGSIHNKHLEKQGYHITNGRESNILKSLFVKDVMQNDIALIPEHLALPKLITELIETPHSTFYTINKNGKLNGSITANELRPIITEYEHLKEMLVMSDIAKPDITTVTENDNLDYVLKLFGHENNDEFPVISNDKTADILGTVRRQDVIAAYNKESLKYNLADGLAHDLKAIKSSINVPVAEGYSIRQQKVPRKFIGKTLVQIRLRNKYGLEVLMIKKGISPFSGSTEENDFSMPNPNYLIKDGDVLVLFGQDESFATLKGWS